MALVRVWTRKQFHGRIPRERPVTLEDNQRYYLYLAVEVHRSVFDVVYDEAGWNDGKGMDNTRANLVWSGVDR